MEISNFSEKLNRLDGTIYTVEERVLLENGVYESVLQHDNVRESTINVYTGSKLTGDRIESWVLSTPSITPWKRIIRIHADVQEVYISYETIGDTVEAEDINNLQTAVLNTQVALNDEAKRAEAAEETLTDAINSEKIRAEKSEELIRKQLQNEITRAEQVETSLSEELEKECQRALEAERLLSESISSEINRAVEQEEALALSICQETDRAQAAERDIWSEIEGNKPVWEDKYTKNEIDNKFSVLESNIDWKESVCTYEDIAVEYPDPQDGWTVNVKDTDYTYRWNGTEWVAISANSIPKATQSLDGLLAKEDKVNYDDANSKKHTHSNKSTLDGITSGLISGWNNAAGHVGDSVKHITSSERTLWNTVSGKAPDNHTHNYAGSSTPGGAATSAAKLATSRTVNALGDMHASFKFDGSGDVSYNLWPYHATVFVNNTNNYPFHRFAKLDTITISYVDKSSTFLVTQDYAGGGFGIFKISLRTNNSQMYSDVSVDWLVRKDIPADSVQVGLYNIYGKTYADAFFKTTGPYMGTVIRNLASGARGQVHRTWELISSVESVDTTTSDAKTSKECYTSVEAAGTTLHNQAYSKIITGSDRGTVQSANSASKLTSSAGSETQPVYFSDGKPVAGKYSLNKSVPSNAVFTDTTYSVFKAATASTAGGTGLVPAPAAGKQDTFLRGDGTWQVPTNTITVDSALSSTSTNPVQNKVINSVLSGKVRKGCTWNELMGV